MSANKDLPIFIRAANFDELLAAVAKIKALLEASGLALARPKLESQTELTADVVAITRH